MAKYSFSNIERFSVYVTHGEKCYLCTNPIDLQTMQVDHVIPEILLENTNLLNKTLIDFGLPSDFNINSYSNWMPSCPSCNRKKLATIFNPTPIIQVILEQAIKKANKAAELASNTISNKKISRALNILKMADESGNLNDEIKLSLKPLVEYQIKVRLPELKKEEINISPHHKIRRFSHKIKNQLVNLYNAECQICGFKDKSIIQVCAIKPLNVGGEIEINNLLLLCPNHHHMFDKGSFGINDDFSLIGYSGSINTKAIHNISINSIKWHRKYIFKSN